MTTRAIAALLKIMLDDEVAPRRRLEAAEHLLTYEAPLDVIEAVKAFLTLIFEDDEQDVDDRLDALKLMRKAEAPRVTQPTVSAQDAAADLETWRQCEIGFRRVALKEAGLWPPLPGWCDDLRRPDYKPPTSTPFREVWMRAITRPKTDPGNGFSSG